MHQVDPSSKLIGSNLDFGSQGSKGFLHQKRGDLVRPPNLTRALGKGRMSSYYSVIPTGELDVNHRQRLK